MTADPFPPLEEIRYGDWRQLMQERPNPRPCLHPFDPLGWNTTTVIDIRDGLCIVHTYACPDCGELVATHHTPLKEILR